MCTLNLKEKTIGSENLIRSEGDNKIGIETRELHDRDGKFVLSAWFKVGEINVRKLKDF